WWLIPLLGVTTWVILRRTLGEKALHYRVSQILLKLPLLGRILADLEMCKYIRTLAILIGNHVEIIRTMKISSKIIRNPVIAEAFSSIERKLKSGSKLSAALQNNIYLPSGMAPMLRVGEESGTVGEMLDRIATHLENDTRQKIKRLLSLFEPAVIIFLAAMVLVVVVSIFVSMMELNAINQGGPKL
ncbi:MAG: type II secretion system F family protein, partial [Lentisphaeria bacterium]|nr:type II secretion system F family protein [Lentisphaeria bacterium]